MKRKFPGPAGLLTPDMTLTQVQHNKEVPMTQNTITQSTTSTWERMRQDFEILNEHGVYLSDKYNIACVKAMAKNDRLTNQKAPFLAAIVTKINTKTPIVAIVLKDATDQIHGTVVGTLFHDYNSFLTVGSVIVLRQVGVLTTRDSNYYLMITSNNLIKIYNGKNDITVRSYTPKDFTQTVQEQYATCEKTVEKTLAAEKVLLSQEDEKILYTIFDGVDVDSLFGDF
ncbi:hypothetical protein FQA39_LY14261 [Lamprigera yunnana]|nr:hypothetical protein FQA39_LY14261 [Lamprigera yunnana]